MSSDGGSAGALSRPGSRPASRPSSARAPRPPATAAAAPSPGPDASGGGGEGGRWDGEDAAEERRGASDDSPKGLGTLGFTDKDMSNAAKIPTLISQLHQQSNIHSRLLADLVQIQGAWQSMQIRYDAMEKGVIEMRKRAETFSGKEEVAKLAESLEMLDSDGQARQKQAAEKADAALAAVKRDAAGVEARVDALFSGAKEARVRLGEHGQLIEESKGRLDSCEGGNAALREELREKMAMLEEREARRMAKEEEAGERVGRLEGRVGGLEAQLALAAAENGKLSRALEEQSRDLVRRIEGMQKKAEEDKVAVETRLQGKLDLQKKSMQKFMAETRKAFVDQDGKFQDDLEGNYNMIMDKIMRTAEDSTDLGARVYTRLENESRRIDDMVKEGDMRNENEIKEFRGLMQHQMRQFQIEVSSAVEVFKSSIMAMGPEMKETAKRETFDLTQQQLRQHYLTIERVLASKVDTLEASEIFKRKADSITLDSFTRKADVDAMIGTALRALQKRIFKIEEATLGMGSPRYPRSPRSGSRSPGSGEGSPQGPGGVDIGRDSEARLASLEGENRRLWDTVSQLSKNLRGIETKQKAAERRDSAGDASTASIHGSRPGSAAINSSTRPGSAVTIRGGASSRGGGSSHGGESRPTSARAEVTTSRPGSSKALTGAGRPHSAHPRSTGDGDGRGRDEHLDADSSGARADVASPDHDAIDAGVYLAGMLDSRDTSPTHEDAGDRARPRASTGDAAGPLGRRAAAPSSKGGSAPASSVGWATGRAPLPPPSGKDKDKDKDKDPKEAGKTASAPTGKASLQLYGHSPHLIQVHSNVGGTHDASNHPPSRPGTASPRNWGSSPRGGGSEAGTNSQGAYQGVQQPHQIRRPQTASTSGRSAHVNQQPACARDRDVGFEPKVVVKVRQHKDRVGRVGSGAGDGGGGRIWIKQPPPTLAAGIEAAKKSAGGGMRNKQFGSF